MITIRQTPLYLALLILVTCSVPLLLSGQSTGHRIAFNFTGQPDSSFILVRHYGNKLQLADSTYITQDGLIVFEGPHQIPGGVYVLANERRNKLVEFIVSNNQHFTVVADFTSDKFHIYSPDDDENSLFFGQLSITYKINREQTKLKASFDSGLINETLFLQQTDSLNRLIVDYRQKIIDSVPDSFIASLFRAMEETAVPDAVMHDPLKAYHYFKSHYWDRFNLTDDRLLRSPVFHPRLDYYFKQLVPPVPDSVIRAIDKLILLTGDNIEFRDYLIWHFTSEYQNSTIMGMDKVFVHMADNYFSKTTVTNTSASVLEKIKERADQLRKLMIGVSAPDIWLIDTSGNYRSFREIKKEFTVLFFWDFDCGVCIKEMDALVKLHNSQTYDMEVFAIGTNSNLEGWKDNVIRKKLSWINVNGTRSLNADFHDLYDIYGTPVIYLLDKEKKIIAKRIKAERISLVIDNYRLTLNKN